jgi:hypothetical protein
VWSVEVGVGEREREGKEGREGGGAGKVLYSSRKKNLIVKKSPCVHFYPTPAA